MRSVIVCVLSLAAGNVAGAPAPFAKPARTELEKLQGEWQVVSETRFILLPNGDDLTVGRLKSSVRGRTATVSKDCLRWCFVGVSDREELIRLDGKNPGQIDLTCTYSRKTRRGVYKLEGDVLTLCLARAGDVRPSSLAGGRHGEVITVLRRKR
jgi:uncharacterized protein (TIGR03067 family)